MSLSNLTPNPALGRSTGTMTVAGVTLTASTGATGVTLSPGTARSVLTQFKTWKNTYSNETENISATSSRNKNMVITESGTDIEITGFLFANDSVSTPSNYLTSIINSFDYIQYVATYAGRTWTGYGVIKGYDENIDGKGAINFTLNLEAVDPGSANPVMS